MSHPDEKKYSEDGGHESVPHYLIISSGMDPVGCRGGASPWKIPTSLISISSKAFICSLCSMAMEVFTSLI